MDAFKNKVAIITGGASGIGRALCQALSDLGAIVIVADINLHEAKKVVAALNINKLTAYAIQVDVSNAASVEALINQTLHHCHVIDFMFNNAGISTIGEIRDFAIEEWVKAINVNLIGTILGSHYAYQVFLKQGFGHIINVASVNGLFPSFINAPYVVSKSAVIRYSECLRVEAADFNISISVACPNLVTTNLFKSATVRNVDPNKFLLNISRFQFMSAEVCANQILKGVIKKKFMIYVPKRIMIISFLYRIFPYLFYRLGLKVIREFRKIRQSGSGT